MKLTTIYDRLGHENRKALFFAIVGGMPRKSDFQQALRDANAPQRGLLGKYWQVYPVAFSVYFPDAYPWRSTQRSDPDFIRIDTFISEYLSKVDYNALMTELIRYVTAGFLENYLQESLCLELGHEVELELKIGV